MKKWQYRLLSSAEVGCGGSSWSEEIARESLDRYLNNLGHEGWEICDLSWESPGKNMAFVGVAKRDAD